MPFPGNVSSHLHEIIYDHKPQNIFIWNQYNSPNTQIYTKDKY